MADLQWDRLLETCVQSGARDMLFIPGSPPLIRLESWRALQTAPLEEEDVRALAYDRLCPGPYYKSDDGYAYVEFSYLNRARFRALVFGRPLTCALLISRIETEKDDPSGSPSSDGGDPASS